MHHWTAISDIKTRQYTCGYCDRLVASARGFTSNFDLGSGHRGIAGHIHICPNCSAPSYFDGNRQIPGVSPGNSVDHLPKDIDKLYSEARKCVANGSPTAAVLACRKLLMNIAVEQGAKEGESFVSYVDYLAQKGYVPPNGRGWVDHIRKKGNEANHEIVLMTTVDASELISFSEMLLKFIFEFPEKIPKPLP